MKEEFEAVENVETAVAEPSLSADKKEKILRSARACLLEAALYAGVFLLTFALFIVFKPFTNVYRNGVIAQVLIVLALAGSVAVIAYLGATKRLKTRHIVIALLVIGYALRVGYMLYTPAATRQQDTYTKNFDGHEAYAWTIFETGALPTSNVYQFYHPPLNATLQAGFMHFMNALTSSADAAFFELYSYAKPEYVDAQRFFLYSACQILAVFYSFVIAVVSLKMLKTFGFSDKLYLVLAAFVVLYPRQIQFSGMLNNDGLSYLLAVLALFFALRWWKGKKSLVYILLCGFAVGFGMMAKLSSATVCIPIAGIFIYEFICTLRKKEGSLKLWEMVLQYGLFLCICAPIGLWFQVYASVRFDQPLGYVFSNLNHKLYTGHHSFFSRFFIVAFDISEYFGSVFCRPFEGNYNLFNYALRSSIFGEFSYWQGEGFAVLSIILAYMVALLLLIGLVWCAALYFKKRKDPDSFLRRDPPVSHKDLLFAFLLVQSQVLSEVYFYIKMPYGCTMDFRYIMPLIFGMALTFGFVQKTLVASEGKLAFKLSRILYIACAGFLISSTLFYCVCI